MIDFTHDPKRVSWVSSAKNHPEFPIQNLPFGVFSPKGQGPRIGVAIGDYVLDLAHLPMPEDLALYLAQPNLNALFSVPAQARLNLRQFLSEALCDVTRQSALGPHLYPQSEIRMHLPAHIGDYTDFYVGIHHATSVGKLFRPENPLLPNYKYVPIGYHGRASSVVESGVRVIRPKGQLKLPDQEASVFAPSKRLDYELEMGVFVAGNLDLGEGLSMTEAPRHIAGLCLLNDWSARDIQAWEYQPLGPFLAKSFHTTISPWVVTMEALEPFRCATMQRNSGDPEPLDYLKDENDQKHGAFSIQLSVSLLTETMRKDGADPHRLSTGSMEAAMYWSLAQIVTHHASNGCNLSAGDLIGTGTLSGAKPDQAGSLLELTKGGKIPVKLNNGEIRTFIEDGDTIIFEAQAHAPGAVSIGFGRCEAQIYPARS